MILPQKPAQSPSPATLNFDDTFLNPISPSELLILASLPDLSQGREVPAQPYIDKPFLNSFRILVMLRRTAQLAYVRSSFTIRD
jgi:hypothetical protein